jgi:hypothetical protein
MTMTDQSAPAAIPGMPVQVVCRNMMPGPTTISSDQKSTVEVVFGGKDDPEGTDYQIMPEEIVRTPQFSKAISHGILEVSQGREHPQVQTALQRQSDAFWRRSAAEETAARESLDAPQQNDLIAVSCIGPGPRPGAVCGTEIPIYAREAALNPPLCPQHSGLKGQCIRRGDGPWELEA